MNIELGICHHPNEAAGLAGNNFDFLEVNVQSFLVPEKAETDFYPNLHAGLNAVKPVKAANCFLPGDLCCVGPEVDRNRLQRYATNAFRRAEALGIDIIVFGSGGARNVPEGYPLEQARKDFICALRLFGPIAQRHGITLVIEPLNRTECNFINSLTEGAELVERCDHPNVRLLADLYHMQKEGETVAEILRFGGLLGHAHVAERTGRFYPGKSGENFRPFFKILQQIQYAGRVALECNWENIGSELAPSIQYLREQMKD